MTGLIVVVVSYLIGSIPMAFVIGKYWKGIDIRRCGSGNVGATNAFRVMGPAAGLTVLAADVLKGVVAVLLARYFGGPFLVVFAGFLVILGHTFSLYLKFRGGKGVATGAGTILAIAPKAVLWALVIFIIVVLLTRYVSLGSILAAASIPVFLIVYAQPWQYILYGFLAAGFVIYKHRSNMARLRNGTEPRITERFR